jgi:PAS domain S-box-containing protein
VPLRDEDGRIVKWYGTLTDIEDRKRAEALLAGEKRVLEMVAKGDSLAQILDCLCRLVEEQASGVLASILLIEGNRLRHGGAPSLPKAYTEAVDGVVIGACVGSCGTAAYLGEQVIVEDIATDPLWADYREVALPHSLRACWSTPVFSSQRKVIATFAMYYREPRIPSLRDQEFIEQITDLAGVAIERKLTQEALRQNEAYLAEAQRLTKTGSWAYDIATQEPIYWSEEMFRIFGLDPQRRAPLNHEEFLRLMHPEDRAGFSVRLEAAIRDKVERVEDYRLVMPDGTIKHIHETEHPVRDATGEVVAYVGTSMDVTERKRAEEALRRSETYLAEAQRLTHTGSWALDPVREMLLHCSEEVFRVYEVDLQESPPAIELLLERVHPEDRDRVRELRMKGARDKVEHVIDYRLLLPDGTIKYIHSIRHPVLNAAGDIVEFVGTSMDVTEQVRNREALEEAFVEIKALKDQLHKENLALRDEVDRTSMFEEIVGASPPLQEVLAKVAKVGPTDSTVLITGETGTGKELIARAIHKGSRRSGRAFVSVNCAALAPSLISSELFGHEKGAFTGAMQRRLGRFELADAGTIFLDEVGELPPDTQVALLRVLQEREFERVGGTQSIKVDLRVITATNRDLKAAVAGGTFRQDLFYRLNVFPIDVPPLRERSDDILMLVEYFVRRYAMRTGKSIRSINKKTLELFQSYDWPGNIRELQNVVERSVILSPGDVFSVDESWLSKDSSQHSPRLQRSRWSDEKRGESEIIEAALTESRGRVAGPNGAAARLGISPSTLESKIKALNIRKSQFKFR